MNRHVHAIAGRLSRRPPQHRSLAILDRHALKWFRSARGQFQLYYQWGADHPEYQPDFVAETADHVYMLEPRMSTQLSDRELLARRDVTIRYCQQATHHTATNHGKPWTYVLIPHDDRHPPRRQRPRLRAQHHRVQEITCPARHGCRPRSLAPREPARASRSTNRC